MPERFLKKNLNAITKIIDEGSKKSGRKSTKLHEEFIKHFYMLATDNFLKNNNKEYLYTSACSLWDFVSDRKRNVARKVRVYNPTDEINGWSTSRTIVELNKSDSPFILDSVTAELTGRGYRI